MEYDHVKKRWEIIIDQSQNKKDDSIKDNRSKNEEEKSDK